MKRFTSSLIVMIMLSGHGLLAQGTLLYDQQSSDESFSAESSVALTSTWQPVGQSFTPSLSAVGFIALQLYDGDIFNARGATIVINLRTNSITGPILASTIPSLVPNGFNGGYTNFFFASNVSVTPGSTYYFQPFIQSGDGFLVGRLVPGSDYPGGVEYINGLPGKDDLWFREGIVVPEPSSVVLTMLGSVAARCARRRFRNESRKCPNTR
jgi:hypothetical protein